MDQRILHHGLHIYYKLFSFNDRKHVNIATLRQQSEKDKKKTEQKHISVILIIFSCYGHTATLLKQKQPINAKTKHLFSCGMLKPSIPQNEIK